MDGSTVTVILRVFAGIDVRVTLGGRTPDQVNTSVPILAGMPFGVKRWVYAQINIQRDCVT